jgi:urease accessory protein
MRRMSTDIITTMADQAAHLRLLTWLSPSFPVGAFGYSHGLERAAHDGLVSDADTLLGWLRALLQDGGAWNDLVLLAEAHRAVELADTERLMDVAELAQALASSAERSRETLAQGRAFLEAVRGAWPNVALDALPTATAYPVAVGAAAAANGVTLQAALAAYAHAFCANLVAAATRLMPIGQTGAVWVMARLEPYLLQGATAAAASTLDDLGSGCLMSDICALRHETQAPRIFVT